MKIDLLLPRLPLSAKLLVSAFLISMALNHAFAGALVWSLAHSAAGGAKDHFQYKNLAYMLRMSHEHSFGHGTMYMLAGAVFLLSSWPERRKAAVVLAPFLGAWIDLASWWLQKYAAADYDWLSAVGGALFCAGFVVIFFRTFYELWLLKPEGE